MDARDVRAARRRVRVADGQVDRAVDLLVEADVLGEPLDPWVAADSQLPEPTRPLVGVERAEQELLTTAGARLDDSPSLEDKAHADDLVPEVDGGELAEADDAVD